MNGHESRPTRAWTVDIRAAGLTKRSGPGLSAPLELSGPCPEHVRAGVLSVPAGSPITLSGRLESVAEGVLISAQADATATGSCARCLTDISLDIQARLQELYAYPDSATAQTTDSDEVPRLADEQIDLEPLLHDELVLALPAIPLCRPDCPGLCPECGERMDELEPGHRHEIIDPRWAALAKAFAPDAPNIATTKEN